MGEINQWEYQVQVLGSYWNAAKPEDVEDTLNTWGETGWEVIAAVPASSGSKVTFIARRPLTSTARRRRSRPEY
jgi:hypothetical protein